MTSVLEQYKAGGLATAEDIAKLTAARGAARTVKAAAPATGVLAGKAVTEKQEITAGDVGSADDLLA